jgi:hypothetical protein
MNEIAAAPDHKDARHHVPKLVRASDAHGTIFGSRAIGRFNAKLAVAITKRVGTMWAAYIFTGIALVGAYGIITNNTTLNLVIVLLSQTFLQLVLLPVIIVGQNIISASQDARAEADHETLSALHSMSVTQLQILEQQNQILDMLKAKA